MKQKLFLCSIGQNNQINPILRHHAVYFSTIQTCNTNSIHDQDPFIDYMSRYEKNAAAPNAIWFGASIPLAALVALIA